MKSTEVKECLECGIIKTREEFSKNVASTDGLNLRCKECDSALKRKRYADRKMGPVRAWSQPKIKEGAKECIKCHISKFLHEFDRGSNMRGGRLNECKTCRSAYRKMYRDTNPDKLLEQERRSKKLHIQAIRDSAKDYCTRNKNKIKFYNKKVQEEFSKKVALFLGGKCEMCGLETDWYEVYDCHHKNSEEKMYNVASLRHKNWTTIVIPELLKCSLVCRNCHRVLTQQIARSKPNREKYCDYMDNRRDNHKQKCVDYAGGECQICNLRTTNYAVYDFHHVNPATKIYNIGPLNSKDWEEVVQPELNKCALLCANCHVSLHTGRHNSLTLIAGPIKIITD